MAGVKNKKIDTQCLADGLGVDGVFGEYLLHGARMHMDTLGKPLVGVVLPPKFLLDVLADVYLHKKNREFLLLALEVLDYLSPIQRSSRFVTRASCFLLGDSKTRNCPDSECYFASINAFFVYPKSVIRHGRVEKSGRESSKCLGMRSVISGIGQDKGCVCLLIWRNMPEWR